MESLETVPVDVAAPPRRRPLFLFGVLLFFLGLAIYIVQFSLRHLVVPWYMAILATVGVLFVATSAWQRRGVLRIAGLILFALVCGFEWFFLLVGSRSPVYTGPAQPGHEVPAFDATLASGESFTDKDLEAGIPTVLVFFRGRW